VHERTRPGWSASAAIMATPSNPYAPRRSGASPSSSAAAEQTIGKFKRLEHIGKGSFAEVYRGIHIVRHPR
jgi:serine/threonine-protein kinase ULK/ATG1